LRPACSCDHRCGRSIRRGGAGQPRLFPQQALRAWAEAALRIRHSFGAAAEAFITDKLQHERSGAIAERDLRANFVAIWRERPISEITKFDVLEVINAKKRSGAPQMARALLVLIRRFFNWVLDQHTYGLDRSPCDRLKPNSIIGAVPKRNRRLNDAELFAFWRATERMQYRGETQRREFDRRSAVEGIVSSIIVYRFGISTL